MTGPNAEVWLRRTDADRAFPAVHVGEIGGNGWWRHLADWPPPDAIALINIAYRMLGSLAEAEVARNVVFVSGWFQGLRAARADFSRRIRPAAMSRAGAVGMYR